MALACAVSVLAAAVPSRADTRLDLSTATIADLQRAMDAGVLSAEKLIRMCLARIEAYDKKGPRLNAVITVNPRAIEIARELDEERRAKGPRSPLHGIPVVAKDVFDTFDMPTTGGFKPMAGSQPSRDSFVIARLREAGAVILAKLNQSDWYGIAAPGGSTLQGPVISPYNAGKYGGGSSSGTGAAIAAWYGWIGLGSDTGGSIVNPTAHGALVGIAATEGLISRAGMMWSSPGQEKGGPMCRSVHDCAAALDVIAGYDPEDLITERCIGRLPDRPYASFVDPRGLEGARIGVLREMFRSGPLHTDGLALMEKALEDMAAAGAILVDPALTGLNLLEVQNHAGEARYARAAAIDAYLARLPADAPIRSVREMIEKGGDLVKPAIIEAAAVRNLERHPGFIAVKKQQEMLRSALIGLMDQFELDCLVLPYRTAIPDDFSTEPRDVNDPRRAESRNSLHSYTGLPTILVPRRLLPGRHAVRRAVDRQAVLGADPDPDRKRIRGGHPPSQGAEVHAAARR